MTTTIFYTTGTGNSLWVARQLAAELGEAAAPRSMIPMTSGTVEVETDNVVLVFPVHMWGVPRLVLQFVDRLKKDPAKRYFALAVNAGQVSRTLLQLRSVLERDGLALSAGYDLVLPSNYIPWGGPPPSEQQQALFEAARTKIKRIAAQVRENAPGPIEKGPLWQRILFTGLYRLSFNQIPSMDKGFWVDARCNSCGICEKVCPVANVVMQEGKPSWQHRCVQCLSCIQWCPREALQLGKKTPSYQRYHHPDVTLKDMLSRQG